MTRRASRLVGLGSLAVYLCLAWPAVASAQPAPISRSTTNWPGEPAPWTVPGKWGKRGNWGRWGEDDKRGMLNYITPDLVVKAAGLVKQGKVYPLGEELTTTYPGRSRQPRRHPIILENDGYDRVTQPGEYDPKRQQGAASFTFMHNHMGTHLDTFAHVYRENALFNNMPPPKPVGTAHGDAASVQSMVGAASCLTLRSKGRGPAARQVLDHTRGSPKHGQGAECGDPQGGHTAGPHGMAQDVGQPGPDGRVDAAHTKIASAPTGVGPDCLAYLNEMEIVAIGSDTAAVEWGFPGEPGLPAKGVRRVPRFTPARRLHLEPRRLHHRDPQPRRAGQRPGLRVPLHPRHPCYFGAASASRSIRSPFLKRRRRRCDPRHRLRRSVPGVLRGVHKSFPVGTASISRCSTSRTCRCRRRAGRLCAVAAARARPPC